MMGRNTAAQQVYISVPRDSSSQGERSASIVFYTDPGEYDASSLHGIPRLESAHNMKHE